MLTSPQWVSELTQELESTGLRLHTFFLIFTIISTVQQQSVYYDTGDSHSSLRRCQRCLEKKVLYSFPETEWFFPSTCHLFKPWLNYWFRSVNQAILHSVISEGTISLVLYPSPDFSVMAKFKIFILCWYDYINGSKRKKQNISPEICV